MKKIVHLLAFILVTTVSMAQWNIDTLARNPVCKAAGAQYYPRSCSDGSGGAIFVWVDQRNSGSFGSVYAQRIAANGKISGPANGVEILNGAANNQGIDYATIITDGAGGAIIVTQVSVIGGARQLYAQHINASGVLLWGGGVRLTDITDARLNWVEDPEQDGISADGLGGAFITYWAGKAYAQHIDGSGILKWGTTGVGMPLNGGNIYNGYRSTIQNTGNGTAVVGFSNLGGGSFYMQRIAANGSYLWGASGLLISNHYINQNFEPAHIITYDALNSTVMVAFLTEPFATSNLSVQKIDLNGNLLWNAGGILLTNSLNQNLQPDILPDNKGGLFLCYNSSNKAIVQRINSNGKRMWGLNGIAVDNTPSTDQHSPVIVPDGFGGIINVYKTSRNGTGYYSIYTQRFTAAGAPVWRADAVPVIIAFADINHEVNNTIASTKGYAITCWHDSRKAGDNNDIYAAREGGANGFGFLQNGNSNVSINDAISFDLNNTAKLSQNNPNPFTNTTTINYTLPQSLQGGTTAQIIITDKNGKTIKALNISGSGKGTLKIDASTLTSGAYSYSLYVDGKLVDSKQMILAK